MTANTPNPHHALLERQLPAWAREANAEHWQRLSDAILPTQGLPAAEAAWFANAAPHLREAVRASQARLMQAQRALAKRLRGLKSINAFAEPLLAERLRAQHAFSAPLRSASLVRVKHLYSFQVYLSHHEHHSLLEAALQNFSDTVTFSRDSALALDSDWQASRIVVTGRTTLGDSETEVDIDLPSEQIQIKALALSPEAFASTCRELDLGQAYQDHLHTAFAASGVRAAMLRVYQNNLRLAADLARVRHRLTGAGWDALQAVLEDGKALPCSQLSLFGIPLHEAALIDTVTSGIVLYLPGQVDSLRAFDSLEALHRQLRSDLQQAPFLQAFMACVPSEQQGQFTSRLRQNTGGDLRLRALAFEAGLYDFLHDDHLARLKREALQLAVPTAQADEQARKARKALWDSAGLDMLMIAGMFVPALGTIMTAVIAYQLLDEVYEGYEAWQVGDREQAMAHLKSVGLNLALIGSLHLAGKGMSRLASSPLMESLEAVTLEDGSQRLRRATQAVQRDESALKSALKGLYLPHQASLLSERLIINAMPQLRGWPEQLRLELRVASPQGPLLLIAGAQDASRLCTVLKSAEGYEAYLGERPVPLQQDHDLCRAVMQALSSDDRAALGLTATHVDELRRRIHTLALSDRALAGRLLNDSTPGWGNQGQLRGGMHEPAPPVQRMELGGFFLRYRALYPETADVHVNEQLSQWLEAGLDPALQLTELEQQLLAFRDQVRAWAGDNPLRQAAARRLVSNWQRISEFSEEEGQVIHQISLTDLALTNQDLASLALPDSFTHIQRIDLTANPALNELPAEFLERFPQLQRLHLKNCGFAQVPAITAPRSLQWLDMQDNGLLWNDTNQVALDRLDGLRLLDLSHNPLGRSPDLSRLDTLDVLSLNSCQLTDWPTGIRDDDGWRPVVVDLRDNRFTHLPDNLHLSRVAAQALWLESAELGERVSQQIQAYYEQNGVDLLVADDEYEEMLENTDADDWSIWNDLPLQYRRELRGLQDLPDYTQPQLWQRLRTFADPRARDYGLSIGAMRLMDAEVFPPPFEE
ncbi:dermonecrotic toxin domain-containing protein [Pseudomonas sp. CAM1A]|uniref:dermonecrotic toxin domain-containing protein n=1 Tax=Pseudomonas sp. CAM1A TaxID=3231717 RepID=UPI0039C661A2